MEIRTYGFNDPPIPRWIFVLGGYPRGSLYRPSLYLTAFLGWAYIIMVAHADWLDLITVLHLIYAYQYIICSALFRCS